MPDASDYLGPKLLEEPPAAGCLLWNRGVLPRGHTRVEPGSHAMISVGTLAILRSVGATRVTVDPVASGVNGRCGRAAF